MCLNVRVVSVPMRRIEHHNLEVPTRVPMPGPRLKIKSNVVYIICLKTKVDFKKKIEMHVFFGISNASDIVHMHA